MTFWDRYRSSFSLSMFWRNISIFGVFVVSYKILFPLITTWWIEPIASKFPTDSTVVNLLFLALFVYAIRKLILLCRNKLIPTGDGLTLFLFSLSFFLIIRNDPKLTYYRFNVPYFHWLSYIDALYTLTLSFWIPFSTFSRKISVKNEADSLLSDDPDPGASPDIAGNSTFIQAIGDRINNTTTETSFAIGIFAPWGSGKTHFLLSLGKYLRPEGAKNFVNEVIYFNPWRNGNVESIVDDFFIALSKALKPYNKSISQDIKRYSKKIFGTGKDFSSRIADALVDEFIQDFSIEEKYSTIKKGIISTGKRFVFLIDDIDRMTGTEIMQIFKLIRTSASFGNVFFVVTLDLRYTITVLQKTASFSMEEDYLKKIFQLTITLPPIPTETLSGELIHLLLPKDFINMADAAEIAYYTEINNIIGDLRHKELQFLFYGSPQRRSYLELMLDNYRDLKRFANAFSISSRLMRDNLNISDLFLLELIKVKSIYAYENLANANLLKHEGENGVYVLDDKAWESLCSQNIIRLEAEEHIKKTINRLFEYKEAKGSRQISRRENFYLYFNYQLFGLISLNDFKLTIEQPWTAMSEQFMTWWNGSLRKDLEDILNSFNEYENKDQFRKFLKVFIKNSNERNFDIRAKTMLFNISISNFNVCFGDNETYNAFITEIISDPELSLLHRARIAKEIIVPSTAHSHAISIELDNVKNLIQKQFHDYLDSHSGYDTSVVEFLYINGEAEAAGGHYIIWGNAANDLKKYLQNSQSNFDEFLNLLIRSYRHPNDGSFTFEPFTEQIFGSWEEFQKTLTAHVAISEDVKMILPIILKYKDYKKDDITSFSVDDIEREQILDHLRKTGQYDLPKRNAQRPSKPTLNEIW